MNWNKYNNFGSTTTNAFYQVTPNIGDIKFDTWDEGIIDVTDSYVELESKELICNRCKYSELSIRVNDKTEQLLCCVGEYKKKVDGKTECSKFLLRE